MVFKRTIFVKYFSTSHDVIWYVLKSKYGSVISSNKMCTTYLRRFILMSMLSQKLRNMCFDERLELRPLHIS